MNSSDYRHAWATSEVSALEVTTRPGANAPAVQHAAQRLLGGDAALTVETSAERSAKADTLAREGLSRMSQITLLLMIAAGLAMAAAMGAGIWQRRSSLASLRINSFSPSQLRRRARVRVGAGAADGRSRPARLPVLRASSDRPVPEAHHWLPVPFAVEGVHTVQTILLIVIGAMLVLTIPGYVASRSAASWRCRTRTLIGCAY